MALRDLIRPATRGRRVVQDEGGSSLVEVLIAAALLGYSSLAFGALLLTATATREMSWEHTELSSIAVRRMERMLQLPFDDSEWTAGGSLTSSESGYAFDPVTVDGDPNGYVRWQISDESALMKRVVVLAGHLDPSTGNSREVTLETFRLRNE